MHAFFTINIFICRDDRITDRYNCDVMENNHCSNVTHFHLCDTSFGSTDSGYPYLYKEKVCKLISR